MSDSSYIPVVDTSTSTEMEFRSPSANLTQDDFLEIFVANLEQQDPFNSADSNQFVENFINFAMYQGNMDMTEQMKFLYQKELLGSTVTVMDPLTGNTDTGVIDCTYIEDGEIQVVVNDAVYSADDIVQILADSTNNTGATETGEDTGTETE